MPREGQNVVETGVFENAEEVVRAALREFITHRRFVEAFGYRWDRAKGSRHIYEPPQAPLLGSEHAQP